ncbi:RNA-binding S4 domain-containing protein [Actinomyces israelii]
MQPRTPPHTPSSRYPCVPVRGRIRLGQFLKLAGLVEDGAEARMAVQCGDVTVNGETDTRRGRALADGDVVVVDLPTGAAGAVVEVV